jgi:2-methylcitrate dehydratase PrpD
LGTLGAAAGAARTLGLDGRGCADALRLAAGGWRRRGLRGVFGSTGKPAGLGRAAQAGVEAALLAAAGLTGAPGILEAANGGFAATCNNGQWRAGELDSLGQRFSLVRPGIAFKAFPVCSAAQAAVEATLAILAEAGVPANGVPANGGGANDGGANDGGANDVRTIRCRVTPLVAACLVHDRPRTVEQAQFSLPFAVGCALAFGRLDLTCLDTAILADPALISAMERVVLVRDETVAGGNPDFPEAARVDVELEDGRCPGRFCGAATGMPAAPVTTPALERKFLSCAGPVLGRDAARSLLDRLRRIDDRPLASALWGT